MADYLVFNDVASISLFYQVLRIMMIIMTHVHLDIEPHWRSHATLLYYFAVC